MKKCLIIGNCQSAPISRIINSNLEFYNNYSLEILPPIHTWSRKTIDILPSLISKCDIIISQPIISKNYGAAEFNSLKSFNKRIIFIPVAYFEGYFPTVIHLKKFDPRDHDGIPMAQCGLPLFLYSNNVKEKDAIILYKNWIEIDLEIFKSISENSIKQLRIKEKQFDVDIILSDYMQDNYRIDKLMHSLNHPTNIFLKLIADSITKSLGVENNHHSQVYKNELLEAVVFPIFPNIRNSLKIEFKDKVEFKINNKTYSIDEYIHLLYEFYKLNNEIAAFNFQIYQNKLENLFARLIN